MVKVRQIFSDALKLTEHSRIDLAECLLDSVASGDDGDVIDKAWTNEIERRAREVVAGTAKTTDACKMLQRVKRKLQRQKTS